MSKSPQHLIVIGKCGAPHGVRGQIRVKSYTGDPGALGSYGPLHLPDGRKLVISQLRILRHDMLVVNFVGISQRETAEALSGLELMVPRTALPKSGVEEFYHTDLINLAVRLENGEILGNIRAVLNFGAGDILEIAPGGAGEALLLPFTKAVVPHIDLKAGHVLVVLPGEIEVPETRGQI